MVPASYSTVASAAVQGMASPLSSLNRRISSTSNGAKVANVVVFSLVPNVTPYYAAVVDGNDDVVRVFNVTDDPGMTGAQVTVHALGSSGYAQAITFDGINLVIPRPGSLLSYEARERVHQGLPTAPLRTVMAPWELHRPIRFTVSRRAQVWRTFRRATRVWRPSAIRQIGAPGSEIYLCDQHERERDVP